MDIVLNIKNIVPKPVQYFVSHRVNNSDLDWLLIFILSHPMKNRDLIRKLKNNLCMCQYGPRKFECDRIRCDGCIGLDDGENYQRRCELYSICGKMLCRNHTNNVNIRSVINNKQEEQQFVELQDARALGSH